MTIGKAFDTACEYFMMVYKAVIFTIGQAFVFHVMLPFWWLLERGTNDDAN